LRSITWCIIFSLISVSCGSSAKSNPSGDAADPQTATNLESLELTLPAIPDSLVTPQQRAGYLSLHFWDDMDWSNHNRSLDSAFVEQNFANYLSVLPIADSITQTQSVAKLMTAAAADSLAYSFLSDVACRYLDDLNSPMRSEELFILFLREMQHSEVTDPTMKLRYAYRLSEAMKNRPGTKAADFRMMLGNGCMTTLHEAATRNSHTIVVFYDPDCDHCKETIATLSDMQLPPDAAILAVDAMTDRERFEQTKDSLPASWSVAFAIDPIDEMELYSLPALPSIYLIDKSAEVILKDASPSAVATQLKTGFLTY